MNEQPQGTTAAQNEATQDELTNFPRDLAAKMRQLKKNMQARTTGESRPDRKPEPPPVPQPPKVEQQLEPDQATAATAALETLKAREQQQREKAKKESRPVLSPVKRRMIESSVKIGATLAEEIV